MVARAGRKPRLRLSLSAEEADLLWVALAAWRAKLDQQLAEVSQEDDFLARAARERVGVDRLITKVLSLPRTPD